MENKLPNKIIEEDIENIVNYNIKWNYFEGATVLITGANGVLPAYIVETLSYLNKVVFKKDKVSVIALVRNKTKAEKRFSHLLSDENFTIIVQNVCDEIKISQNIDYIIHGASPATPRQFKNDPVGTINSNTIGTNNLLKLAYEKKVKSFLFLSSGAVYGSISNSTNIASENDYGVIDFHEDYACYSEGKRAGETMCIMWHRQYGVPVKIVRIAHTYGPGMDLENDGRVFADFVRDVVTNKDIVMLSDGTAKRNFCYITDAIRGFFIIILNGEDGQAYNLNNDKIRICIKDLAKMLVKLFPEKNLHITCKENLTGNVYTNTNLNLDIKKLKNLGWNPVVDIETGFKRTILSYQS